MQLNFFQHLETDSCLLAFAEWFSNSSSHPSSTVATKDVYIQHVIISLRFIKQYDVNMLTITSLVLIASYIFFNELFINARFKLKQNLKSQVKISNNYVICDESRVY